MKLEIRGDIHQPKILFIHPSVADSRCFEPLFPYLEDFCLLLPTLGGHNISDDSVYAGAKEEARELLKELETRGISNLHAMCAESLGCIVGWEILLSQEIKIQKIIFDGAPFGRFNIITRCLNYWATMFLVRKCRKHPNKMKTIDEAYPQVASSMKQVLAHYTGRTVRNIIKDAMTGVEVSPNAVTSKEHLIVMYGSQDPYIRGLKYFENTGYLFTPVIKDGYGHCTYILKETKDFCQMISGQQS